MEAELGRGHEHPMSNGMELTNLLPSTDQTARAGESGEASGAVSGKMRFKGGEGCRQMDRGTGRLGSK